MNIFIYISIHVIVLWTMLNASKTTHEIAQKLSNNYEYVLVLPLGKTGRGWKSHPSPASSPSLTLICPTHCYPPSRALTRDHILCRVSSSGESHLSFSGVASGKAQCHEPKRSLVLASQYTEKLREIKSRYELLVSPDRQMNTFSIFPCCSYCWNQFHFSPFCSLVLGAICSPNTILLF